eukprot:jgi/Undpi1/12913/HiC_scaffold_7.g02579.m1
MEETRAEDIPPVPLMGVFVVYDLDRCVKDTKEDGVLLYEVCKRAQLLEVSESWEISDDGATLYLKPDPLNFMYYINSWEPRAEDSNVKPESVFHKRDAPTFESSRYEGSLGKL